MEVLHIVRGASEIYHLSESVALVANSLFAVALLHGGEKWVVRHYRLYRLKRRQRVR